MITDVQHAQVFQSIVGFDSVDVIDMLPFFQFAPQVLLHYPSVLQVSDTIDGYAAILLVVVASLMFGIALLAAKSFGSLPGFGTPKDRFAVEALNGALLILSLNPANLRAKTRFEFAVWFYLKGQLAVFANPRDHKTLVSAEAGGGNG